MLRHQCKVGLLVASENGPNGLHTRLQFLFMRLALHGSSPVTAAGFNMKHADLLRIRWPVLYEDKQLVVVLRPDGRRK